MIQLANAELANDELLNAELPNVELLNAEIYRKSNQRTSKIIERRKLTRVELINMTFKMDMDRDMDVDMNKVHVHVLVTVHVHLKGHVNMYVHTCIVIIDENVVHHQQFIKHFYIYSLKIF